MTIQTITDRPLRLLSGRETAKRLGLTPQQFIDLTDDDSGFPGEVYLSSKLWGWVEDEIEDYIDLQIWRRDDKKATWQESRYKQISSLAKQAAAVKEGTSK